MPALDYYRANEGSWSGAFSLQVTDFAALRSDRGLLDALSWVVLSWLPRLRMNTSVRVRSETAVHHTTALCWGPLRLMSGEEALTLDGDQLSMSGTGRTLHGLRFTVEGPGSVDEAAMNAVYELTWMGMALRQTGERTATGVILRQWGPGFQSTVDLSSA